MQSQYRSEAGLSDDIAQQLAQEATPYGRRIVCPLCSHERKRVNQRKKEMTVTLDPSNGMVVYHCHHCGEQGWVKEADDKREKRRAHEPEVEIMDTAMRKVKQAELNGSGLAWFLKRGISQETATKYGCFSSVTWFRGAGKPPQEGAELPSVGLPYVNKTVTYAAKMRAATGRHFTTSGHPQTAFGAQFLEVGKDVLFTEGEPDTLAYAEAGIHDWGDLNACPVSVPFGAPDPKTEAKRKEKMKERGDDEDKRYSFMWSLNDYISAADTIYIATDNDEAGDLLADELARRCGKWKCKRVRFGEHKDANAQLQAEGADALRKGIENAEPWPVEGLYEADEWQADYVKLYNDGLPTGVSTRYPTLNELFKLIPGFVAVVTGAPSSGKSELVDQLMVHWAEDYNWRFAVWSPETPPKYHLPRLAGKLACKPFFHGPTQRMSPAERDGALAWIKNHFYFLHDENGELSSLDSIIERIRIAVLRYGINCAVIDPYNYIEQGNENETKWVNDLMTRLKVTAKAHDIAIFIIAHPTKLMKDSEGKIKPPSGYDISGSANWFNKADYGITVHRDVKHNPKISQVILWKLKFNWMGSPGETELVYNTMTTNYEEFSYDGAEWAMPAEQDMPVMDGGQGFE